MFNSKDRQIYSFLGGARKASSILFVALCLAFFAFGGYALIFGFIYKEYIEPFIVGAMALVFAVLLFIFAALPSIKWLIRISSVSKSGVIAKSKIQNYSCIARSREGYGKGDTWYHVKFDYCFTNSDGKKINSQFKCSFRSDPELHNGESIRVLYNEKYSAVLEKASFER